MALLFKDCMSRGCDGSVAITQADFQRSCNNDPVPIHERPYFSYLKHYYAFIEDLLYAQDCTCPTRVDDKEKWYLPAAARLERARWEVPF